MRRDADREERNARLLAGVVLAAMLVMLSGIIMNILMRSRRKSRNCAPKTFPHPPESAHTFFFQA